MALLVCWLMKCPVAAATHRDEILLTVIAKPTLWLDVVSFQGFGGPTILVSPTVALQEQLT